MTMTFPFFNFASLNIRWHELSRFPFIAGTLKPKGDEAHLEREALLEMMSQNPQAVPNDLSLIAILEQCSRR